jgi:hypothetical protein
MTDLPHEHDESNYIEAAAQASDQAGGFTRRTVIAGAAAATAAASVGAIDIPAKAQTADPHSQQHMILFVLLSAALTGIGEKKLAPGFRFTTGVEDKARLQNLDASGLQQLTAGSDPVDIKKDYFNWVNERRPAAFETLLRITRESLNPDRAKSIIEKAQSNTATKYLARSIVLMWYLGAWYDPDDLMAHEKASGGPIAFVVISPKAYTQGWVLRVAQAHPMGFSELQFGYWSRPPNPLEFDFG